jgi:hypothetical protein
LTIGLDSHFSDVESSVRCEEGVGDEVLLFDFGEGTEELGVVGFEEGFGQACEVGDGRDGTIDLG